MTICTPTTSPALEVDDLRELIGEVNQTALRLQGTHLALHEQVAQLKGELAEANEQLRRSRSLAALGEMAAGIAHEVRNPLGSIGLYAQVLAEDLEDRPEQTAVCRKIMRAVSGLDAVVRDVLRFARDQALRPADTTTVELFDRALLTCEDLNDRVRLCTDPEPAKRLRIDRDGVESFPLQVDVSLMAQALGNLIRNSMQAMHDLPADRRRLILSAERRRLRYPSGERGPAVVLAVADTGPGIPAEAAARIFNPFFTTRPSGTGLGLSIVHRIVDAHGGHLSVQNRPEGGARLEVALPPGSPSEPEAQDTAHRGVRATRKVHS